MNPHPALLRTAFAAIALTALAGCADVPPAAMGCFVYGETSAECTIGRVEAEIEKKAAAAPSTAEMIFMAILAAAFNAGGQLGGAALAGGR